MSERKYRVSWVQSASTYDHDKHEYIPAIVPKSAASWEQLVSMVLKRDCEPRKDGWGIIPSHIKPTRHPKAMKVDHWRLKKACVSTSLLVLDVEEHDLGGDNPEAVQEWFTDLLPHAKALIYTTYSHGVPGKWEKDHPRFRVVIPLRRPVDSKTEYRHLWRWAVEHFQGALDEGTGDPCRLSYTFRAKNPEATLEPWFIELDGDPLDPDDLPTDDYRVRTSVGALVKEAERKRKEREKARKKRLEALRNGALKDASTDAKAKYAKAALKGMIEDIQRAGKGDRHATISRVAARAGTMVDPAYMPEHKVEPVLIAAGKSVLPSDRHSEVERTVKDQLAYGRRYMTAFDWSKIARINPKFDLGASIDWSNVDLSEGTVEIGFDNVPGKKDRGGAQ